MRVASSTAFRQTLAALQNSGVRQLDLQTSLATGIKLNQASQAPADMANAIRIDDEVRRGDRFLQNIQVAEDRMRQTESQMGVVTDRLHRVRELLVQGNNDTNSLEARQQIVAELVQIREGLLQTANSRDGVGRFIFAGTADATAPFQDMGAPTGVIYAGTNATNSALIGDRETIPRGVPGNDVFQFEWDYEGEGPVADDLFNLLSGTIAALGDDLATTSFDDPTWAVTVGPPDTVDTDDDPLTAAPTVSEVRHARAERLFTAMDAGLQQVLEQRGTVGARLKRLDDAAERHETKRVDLLTTASGIRDTDYAEAAGQLTLELTAVQAARQTFTQIQGLSLFDFL